MKKLFLLLLVGVAVSLNSCEDYLNQEDPMALSSDQAYGSVSGINSIVANLYSRLHFDQNFSTDNESYDLTRWDEAINNSQYWSFAGNVGGNYRNYYDYSLIRDINEHLNQLDNVGKDVTQRQQTYFKAEARFLRAMVYFKMVEDLGGVPIVGDVYDYTTTPLEYAMPRDSEAEVYDYIANEVDAIVPDLKTNGSGLPKTRASQGAALALKCRAMLYAGTLAKNYEKSASKGLNTPSGVTGIPKNRSDQYFKACIDAYKKIKDLGYYFLYEQNADLAQNFYELFVKKDNPEQIFYIDYDGVNFTNGFTTRAIARSQRSAANKGSQINPVLNLVNDFELLSTHEASPLDAYQGEEVVENMGDESSSLKYNVFDKKEDIFAGRDPRLRGTIIFPGGTFRGKKLDFQAGLAVKTNNGYEFKEVPTIEDLDDPNRNYFNGVKITGKDGPHRTSYYVSHTGFLDRKFVDPDPGSEASGKSDVPYIIFRYGEVILNAVEAAYKLDQKQLALDLINKIRVRAGGSTFRLTMSELTMKRIQNERRVELAFEDQRFYDLKRWRIADEVWSGNRNSQTDRLMALWPYKIYAPGDPDDGKWIYRKLWVEHRGTDANLGAPVNFNRDMYYPLYPSNEGNPKIEQNPFH